MREETEPNGSVDVGTQVVESDIKAEWATSREAEHRSRPAYMVANKAKMCYRCRRVGHVRSECRDEERRDRRVGPDAPEPTLRTAPREPPATAKRPVREPIEQRAAKTQRTAPQVFGKGGKGKGKGGKGLCAGKGKGKGYATAPWAPQRAPTWWEVPYEPPREEWYWSANRGWFKA